MHLRRIHYLLVSQPDPVSKPDGTPYQNTADDWQLLIRASLAARYLRMVPAGALVDRRNPAPIIHARGKVSPPSVHVTNDWVTDFYMPDSLSFPDFTVHVEIDQPYLMEVWVEKSTMNDVLIPAARVGGFNLVTGLGEMSETAARSAIERCVSAERPLRIFYVSDLDPGGRSMPVAVARKIEFMVDDANLDLDIELHSVVLTPQQVAAYRLPRTPLKDTERRAAMFEERFGAGATELDALEALHPGELRRIVDDAVNRYLDPTLDRRARAARAALQRDLDKVRDKVLSDFPEITRFDDRYTALRDEIEGLWEAAAGTNEAITAKLEELVPNHIEAPEPREPTPFEAPLYSSRRGMLDQLDHYRAWQRGDRCEMSAPPKTRNSRAGLVADEGAKKKASLGSSPFCSSAPDHPAREVGR